MRITWHQLRLFEAVARLGSVTRAAEEQCVVQPTVSLQLKQLAEQVGLPLFEQIGRRLHLTEAGRELQATCSELFETWSRFEMRIADLKGVKRGRLRVAIVTTAKYFVPRMLGPFCNRYPGVEVALEILNRDGVIERLERNLDDLYILGVPPEHLAIERHRFLENPLVVIAPAAHPLAARRRIPVSALGAERFILREKGSGTRIAAEEFFAAQGFEPSVKLALGNNEAIKWAVAGGLGIAVLSRHALHHDPAQDEVAILDVEGFPLQRSWFVCYPQGKHLSVAAQVFFGHLKEAAPAIEAELHKALPHRRRSRPRTIPQSGPRAPAASKS